MAKIWEIFDYPCGQRLKPLLEMEIERLRELGEIEAPKEVMLKLKMMSPATDVAELETPVSLTDGWVSIQCTASSNDCLFAWLNSPVGNLNAIQEPYGSRDDNLAFLLSSYSSPSPGPPGVPTTNQWGIAAMITLFSGLLVWSVRRKRQAS